MGQSPTTQGEKRGVVGVFAPLVGRCREPPTQAFAPATIVAGRAHLGEVHGAETGPGARLRCCKKLAITQWLGSAQRGGGTASANPCLPVIDPLAGRNPRPSVDLWGVGMFIGPLVGRRSGHSMFRRRSADPLPMFRRPFTDVPPTLYLCSAYASRMFRPRFAHGP